MEPTRRAGISEVSPGPSAASCSSLPVSPSTYRSDPEKLRRNSLIYSQSLSAEADEHDAGQGAVGFQESRRLPQGDFRRAVRGKSVGSRRDGRKSDRPQAKLLGGLQGIPVTGRKKSILVPLAARPDGPDGVDHVSGRQTIGSAPTRLARRAAADPPSLFEEPGPRGPVDGPVDASPSEEGRIGGIDDGIRLETGDVPIDKLDPRIQRVQSRPRFFRSGSIFGSRPRKRL